MERQKVVSSPPSLDNLIALITALRSENGCPWDRKQTPRSLAVYLIEEAYELVEAVLADDADGVEEELGDVLFQVFFLLVLYQEKGRISFEQVLARNLEKMIRRHPHVFGEDKIDSAAQVKKRWREIKKEEKGDSSKDSLLDSIPAGMPALMRAYRISERAAGTGFDWDDLQGVIAQAESEWAEFKAEIRSAAADGDKTSRNTAMEFGDILFTLVNVARFARIHPETALAQSTGKFIERFKRMETMAAEKDTVFDRLPRQEMERLWELAKESEKNGVERQRQERKKE